MRVSTVSIVISSTFAAAANLVARQGQCSEDDCFRAVWGTNRGADHPLTALRDCMTRLTTTVAIFPITTITVVARNTTTAIVSCSTTPTNSATLSLSIGASSLPEFTFPSPTATSTGSIAGKVKARQNDIQSSSTTTIIGPVPTYARDYCFNPGSVYANTCSCKGVTQDTLTKLSTTLTSTDTLTLTSSVTSSASCSTSSSVVVSQGSSTTITTVTIISSTSTGTTSDSSTSSSSPSLTTNSATASYTSSKSFSSSTGTATTSSSSLISSSSATDTATTSPSSSSPSSLVTDTATTLSQSFSLSSSTIDTATASSQFSSLFSSATDTATTSSTSLSTSSTSFSTTVTLSTTLSTSSITLSVTSTSSTTSTSPKPSCSGLGNITCSGTCHDARIDRLNCGRCGNACTSGLECVNGVCARQPCDSTCSFDRFCNVGNGRPSGGCICATDTSQHGICFDKDRYQCGNGSLIRCLQTELTNDPSKLGCPLAHVCVKSICASNCSSTGIPQAAQLGICISTEGCGDSGTTQLGPLVRVDEQEQRRRSSGEFDW